MTVELERSNFAQGYAMDNHPDRPSSFLVARAVREIRGNTLNIRVLEAMAFADTIGAAAEGAPQMDPAGFSVLARGIRGIMGPSVRNNTAMVAFALNNGLLDAESVFQKLEPNRDITLIGEDRVVAQTLTARGNWGKSQEELARQLGKTSVEEYKQQVRRICDTVGVENLMQLRVYGLLFPDELRNVPAEKKIKKEPEVRKTLTARQIEVAELKARGLSDSEAGEVLDIAGSTVKDHMKKIKKILHLKDDGETTAIDVSLFLIDKGMLDKKKLIEDLNRDKQRNEDRLTDREEEALKLLLANYNLPQEQLAALMSPPVTRDTFEKHFALLLHKLGLKNHVQTVVYYHLLPEELRRELE